MCKNNSAPNQTTQPQPPKGGFVFVARGFIRWALSNGEYANYSKQSIIMKNLKLTYTVLVVMLLMYILVLIWAIMTSTTD